MREQLKETIIPNFIKTTRGISERDIEDTLINAYIGSRSGNEAVLNALDSLKIKLDIETLTYIFESLLDSGDVNENGIVFTPEYIASYICDEVFCNLTDWNEEYKIIDSGCGCGIFLIAAINVIKSKFNISIKKIIKNNIYGIDLMPENVNRCKRILAAMVEKENETIDEKDIHVICADSLKEDWNDLFNVSGFDFVVGNPPYVNTHDMSKETALFLKENFKTTKAGVYNIFYAFIERAMQYLKENGKLGYIVPNNFLTIKSATELREFIKKNKYLHSIIDFADNMIFKPIRTYNCIIVLDKKENNFFKYYVMPKVECIEEKLRAICYDTMKIENLDKTGWKLVDHTTYKNLKKIENQLKPIKDFVRTGIATLRDEVFMVNYSNGIFWKEIDGIKYEIEPEIVKSLFKIPELKKCTNLEEVKRYIIFPYTKKMSGYEIIEETCLKKKFPNTYKYLLVMKDELDLRDKGKPNPVAWYAYGRTQGLNKYGKKLLFPTFSDKPKFFYVDDDTSLFCNGYAVFENDYLELQELKSILNSKVMEYYVSNTSYSIEGGYYCYQKKYIEKFLLSYFNDKERNILNEGDMDLVNDMLLKKYDLAV